MDNVFIKDLLDLPEQVSRRDYVLRLTEGLTHPDASPFRSRRGAEADWRSELGHGTETTITNGLLRSPQLGLQTVKMNWPRKSAKDAKCCRFLRILCLFASIHLFSILWFPQ